MSYEDYYASEPAHYENDERQAMLTMVLLAVASIVSVALIVVSVMTA